MYISAVPVADLDLLTHFLVEGTIKNDKIGTVPGVTSYESK